MEGEDPDFTLWVGDWADTLFFWSFCVLCMCKMAVRAEPPPQPLALSGRPNDSTIVKSPLYTVACSRGENCGIIPERALEEFLHGRPAHV